MAVTLPRAGAEICAHTVNRLKTNIGDKIEFIEPGSGPVFVETGMPLSHCQLRITDDHDQLVASNHVGHIQVRGENVTRQYYENIGETARLFTKDGWLKTGDIGFLHNNALVVTGRSKNMIIHQGQNFYPHDVESILSTIPELEPGKVVVSRLSDGTQEQMGVFILYRRSIESFLRIAENVRLKLLDTLGITAQVVLPVKKIPKTTSGKIQHYKLTEAYFSGSFEREHKRIQNYFNKTVPLSSGEILEHIKQIISDTSRKAYTDIHQEFFRSGLNSLIMTQATSRINIALGTQLSLQEVMEHMALNYFFFATWVPRELKQSSTPTFRH